MATLIKTDGTHTSVEPKNGKDFKIEELWELVGGYVQIVHINPNEILIVDKDGLNKELPINKEASYLYGDLIVGPALRCLNTQVKMRKIYHVELLATGKHYYFGSKRAICNAFPPEVLGVSYKYLTTLNLANEYRGKKSIIRMGWLVTTGSV